ncbi:MAG: SMP-30/gluconolactonase/LRE family protein [Flavobacterium sp.]
MQIWNAISLKNPKLILGEGAIWSTFHNAFFYIDIEGQKVGTIDMASKITKERQLHEKIGTVVPAEDGRLILGLENSISIFDFDSVELQELIKLEADIPTNRSNDGKCDAKGRLWIGTMNKEAKGTTGTLYSFDGTEIKEKIQNRKVSNGICWSKDNTKMYYIDSFDYAIKSYDFDLSKGTISNEAVIVEMSHKNGTPDGMTIDHEGMLWVAVWGEGCVNRYDPDCGKLLGKVEVNAPNVSSCAFGGTNMTQLLITTASTGLTEEQLKQYPDSGTLFVVDPEIKGIEMNPFKFRNTI